MVIKFRGYLGGHYLNIGTTLVIPIIGTIGQNWTKFGIKPTCLASKKGIVFPCPIRSGGVSSKRHHPGEKSRRVFRKDPTCNFNYHWVSPCSL